MDRLTTIERAFQLAGNGTCHSIDDIRRQLKRENFDHVDGHLGGGTLKRQLIGALKMLE